MMNELEMKNLDIEFQQKKIIMMGGDIKNNVKKLSLAEIEQIKKNYRLMYFGFVSVNWGNGTTLGMAWQKALTQMDAFVASKAKIAGHPINSELVKIHTDFRRHMAKHIMTSDYSENKLLEKHKKLFLDMGEKDLKKSKAYFDNMYQQYMPQKTVEKTPLMHKFGIGAQKAQQMLQQLLIQQQQQMQRAA